MAHILTASWYQTSTYNYVTVNDEKVAVPYELKNGDIIKIYTSNGDSAGMLLNGKYVGDYGYGSIDLSDTDIDYSEVNFGPTPDPSIPVVTINYTEEQATPKVSVDLTTLPGWAALAAKTYNITVVAKANGYRDSEPSAAVSVEKAPAIVMPNKGDIITLDSKQYRILKTEGTIAEVLCMYDENSSRIKFDSASDFGNTYAGKNIDTYCNNTFYSGLSAAMKSAIVDKTFTQDSWRWWDSAPTESHYTGKYRSTTYYLTLVNAAYGSSITRHCYCLSVQDVLDYLEATTSMGTSDTTLTNTNIWKMFWNVTTPQNNKYIWLRSAHPSLSKYAYNVKGNYGYLEYHYVNSTYAARPAFQIDLSKIAWSK